MSQLAKLIELAEEILSNSLASPIENVQKISEYCEAFAAWRANEKLLEQSKMSEVHKVQLNELAEKNAAILEVAERIQSETGREMNEFNKKARGLKAYGDILPGTEAKFRKGKKG